MSDEHEEDHGPFEAWLLGHISNAHLTDMPQFNGPVPDREPTGENPWLPRGPANVGGRVRTIAVDPEALNQPAPLEPPSHTVYAGAASGGVFRTLDDGRSWESIWPYWHSALAIGAIAIGVEQPGGPDAVRWLWVGTGEQKKLPGNGVWCAKFSHADSVKPGWTPTWVHTGTFENMVTAQSSGDQPVYIEAAAVDPDHPKMCWFVGPAGAYRCIEDPPGTFTWARWASPKPPDSGRTSPGFADVKFVRTTFGRYVVLACLNTAWGDLILIPDPTAGQSVIQGQINAAVLKPNNPGAGPGPGVVLPMLQATALPFNTAAQRKANAKIAIVPGVNSANDRVYVLYANADRQSGENTFRALHRREIGTAPANPNVPIWINPQNWSLPLLAAASGDQVQGHYNLCLAARAGTTNSAQDDLVIWGMVDAYLSVNGGQTFVQTLDGSRFDEGDFGQHADQHSIAIVPGSPETIWIGNDGGVTRSSRFLDDQGGARWADNAGWRRSISGLVCAQTYDLAASRALPDVTGIALQDLGGWVDAGGGAWRYILGGDGLGFVFDPDDPYRILASNQGIDNNLRGLEHITLGGSQGLTWALRFHKGQRALFRGVVPGRALASGIVSDDAGTFEDTVGHPTDSRRLATIRRRRLYVSNIPKDNTQVPVPQVVEGEQFRVAHVGDRFEIFARLVIPPRLRKPTNPPPGTLELEGIMLRIAGSAAIPLGFMPGEASHLHEYEGITVGQKVYRARAFTGDTASGVGGGNELEVTVEISIESERFERTFTIKFTGDPKSFDYGRIAQMLQSKLDGPQAANGWHKLGTPSAEVAQLPVGTTVEVWGRPAFASLSKEYVRLRVGRLGRGGLRPFATFRLDSASSAFSGLTSGEQVVATVTRHFVDLKPGKTGRYDLTTSTTPSRLTIEVDDPNVQVHHIDFNPNAFAGTLADATAEEVASAINDQLTSTDIQAEVQRDFDEMHPWEVAFSPSDPELIWVGGDDHVWISTDGGSTWTDLLSAQRGDTWVSDFTVEAIAPDPFPPKDPANPVYTALVGARNISLTLVRIEAVLEGKELRETKSTKLPGIARPDGYITSAKETHLRIYALEADPKRRDTYYAGTEIGVYRSTDGGESWSSFSVGLPHLLALDLALDPATDTLRVAMFGRGVFEKFLGDAAPRLPDAWMRSNTRDAGRRPVVHGPDLTGDTPAMVDAAHSPDLLLTTMPVDVVESLDAVELEDLPSEPARRDTVHQVAIRVRNRLAKSIDDARVILLWCDASSPRESKRLPQLPATLWTAVGGTGPLANGDVHGAWTVIADRRELKIAAGSALPVLAAWNTHATPHTLAPHITQVALLAIVTRGRAAIEAGPTDVSSRAVRDARLALRLTDVRPQDPGKITLTAIGPDTIAELPVYSAPTIVFDGPPGVPAPPGVVHQITLRVGNRLAWAINDARVILLWHPTDLGFSAALRAIGRQPVLQPGAVREGWTVIVDMPNQVLGAASTKPIPVAWDTSLPQHQPALQLQRITLYAVVTHGNAEIGDTGIVRRRLKVEPQSPNAIILTTILLEQADPDPSKPPPPTRAVPGLDLSRPATSAPPTQPAPPPTLFSLDLPAVGTVPSAVTQTQTTTVAPWDVQAFGQLDLDVNARPLRPLPTVMPPSSPPNNVAPPSIELVSNTLSISFAEAQFAHETVVTAPEMRAFLAKRIARATRLVRVGGTDIALSVRGAPGHDGPRVGGSTWQSGEIVVTAPGAAATDDDFSPLALGCLQEITMGVPQRFSVRVWNAGEVDAVDADVTLVALDPSMDQPAEALIGKQKVTIPAGRSVIVSATGTVDADTILVLAQVDHSGDPAPLREPKTWDDVVDWIARTNHAAIRMFRPRAEA
jgi:hypothetical protein